MHITRKNSSDTLVTLTVKVDPAELETAKTQTLKRLAPKVKVAGFREGKVPADLVEKNLDPNYLQTEVIDTAINNVYSEALIKEDLRPVAQPQVNLSKFVPYTELEFTAEVEIIGKVSLPDYKKLGVKKESPKVVKKDIDEVLTRLQSQIAEYTEVDRVAKKGDRATINFAGKDEKGEEVKGAKGNDYPLALGSNTFIPGFEDNVIGLKPGVEKEFTIPFPKDYGVKALQGKKVTFSVTITKLEETKLSELDDDFAKKTGPFKTLDELKADIEKQLTIEKTTQAQKEFEDALVKNLADNTKVELPKTLVEEQIASVDNEFRQNLTYRGETFTEYLANSAQTQEEYTNNELKPAAEVRLKAGLALSALAEKEGITVTPEELEIRMQVLKGQYTDKQMQEELNKPAAKRDIASRLLTEKTIAKLVNLNG